MRPISLSTLEKVLHHAKLVGEESETGMILTNIAITKKKVGNFASAESLLWQAEAIYKRLSNERGLTMIWHNLGWLYVDQGRWQDANFYLETALTTSRKLGDSYMEIETLIGLVKYAIARQDDLGAVVRLEALDRLIDQNPKYNTYRILYTQLKQDCHNLPGIHHR